MAVIDAMLPRPYRIRRRRRDTRDTFTLELERAGGAEPFAFEAGQFNMIYCFGVGEVPVSISGEPGRDGPLVHTIRAVGNVTTALDRLRRGAHVGVRGPFGTHWPVREARGGDMVVMAGGIGLAPLRPVLCQVARHRGDYGKVALLYGTRTPADVLYARDLARWSKVLDVHVTVDRAAPGWTGHVGVVTELLKRVDLDPARTTALICGPEIMMRYAVHDLRGRGVPDAALHLSMERNMKCAVGFCGHCQYGSTFICKDGPVFPFGAIRHWFEHREV